jgi:glycosyltransferase involved in cell wall biosynthesis
MRVLWVYKVFDVGGAEQLLLEVLPNFGPSVEVIPVAVDGATGTMAVQYRNAGLSPIDLCASGPLDVSWVWRLHRLIRRLRPDLVHFHSPLPAALGRPILVATGVPIVYTEHNIWPNYSWATRWANVATYGMNDASLAVSAGVRSSQARTRVGRVARGTRIVRNGIDVEAVRGGAEPPADLPHPVFGVVGHLRRLKGVDVFLQAARLVVAEMPEAMGIIVGSGEDEADLRILSTRLGVDASVDFLGYRSDARRLMRALDVFVVPSRHEGLPVALLEAMTLGRPVVATAVGGVPEVVRDGVNGLLVPPEDPAALAEGIVRLLRDHELASRLAARAVETVEESFTAARAGEQILAVYEQVLRARRPA